MGGSQDHKKHQASPRQKVTVCACLPKVMEANFTLWGSVRCHLERAVIGLINAQRRESPRAEPRVHVGKYGADRIIGLGIFLWVALQAWDTFHVILDHSHWQLQTWSWCLLGVKCTRAETIEAICARKSWGGREKAWSGMTSSPSLDRFPRNKKPILFTLPEISDSWLLVSAHNLSYN